MMKHRLQEHRDKVKYFRDQGSCSRQNCWYKHDIERKENTESTLEETPDEWVESEPDGESSVFQEATNPSFPPTKETIRNQNRTEKTNTITNKTIKKKQNK